MRISYCGASSHTIDELMCSCRTHADISTKRSPLCETQGSHGEENSSRGLHCVVTTCNDVVGCQHFGGPCCLHLHRLTVKSTITWLKLKWTDSKGKVPVLNQAPRHEGVLGEWRYASTHSLTSALDGGEWSASRLGRFTPRERAPCTLWIGSWVGPREVLDAVVKRKNSQPLLPGLEPPSSRP